MDSMDEGIHQLHPVHQEASDETACPRIQALTVNCTLKRLTNDRDMMY